MLVQMPPDYWKLDTNRNSTVAHYNVTNGHARVTPEYAAAVGTIPGCIDFCPRRNGALSSCVVGRIYHYMSRRPMVMAHTVNRCLSKLCGHMS